jgi:hypothetical protein
MIAVDTSRQILYGKTGQSEVWIWWYEPNKQFVITTRRLDTGKAESQWLGWIIGQESIGKESVQADTDSTPADGAHAVGANEDGTAYAWHRQGSIAFMTRVFDDPELYLSWKLYDFPSTTMKQGVLGWAY